MGSRSELFGIAPVRNPRDETVALYTRRKAITELPAGGRTPFSFQVARSKASINSERRTRKYLRGPPATFQRPALAKDTRARAPCLPSPTPLRRRPSLRSAHSDPRMLIMRSIRSIRSRRSEPSPGRRTFGESYLCRFSAVPMSNAELVATTTLSRESPSESGPNNSCWCTVLTTRPYQGSCAEIEVNDATRAYSPHHPSVRRERTFHAANPSAETIMQNY